MNRLQQIRLMKIKYKIICFLGMSHSKYLKKHDIFAEFGDNVLYQPDTLPNNPKLVKIHNNVKIAAGVKFYEHDVINQVFRDMDNNVSWQGHLSGIEIMDNVFIGAYSIIIGDVKIGSNVIIGAGSVITKDVPDEVVIAGNPAKIIGDFERFHKERIEIDANKPNYSRNFRYEHIWNIFNEQNRKTYQKMKGN